MYKNFKITNPALQAFLEHFDYSRTRLGDVKFSAKDWTHPEIQKILDFYEKETNIPRAEVEAFVTLYNQHTQKLAKIAPVLYHTMQHNLVEDTLFTILWRGLQLEDTDIMDMIKKRIDSLPDEMGKNIANSANVVQFAHRLAMPPIKHPVAGAYNVFNQKFNREFNDLIEYIRAEHEKFNPMRSLVDFKNLKIPAPIFTQDPKDPKPKLDNGKHAVTTAAASSNGDFYFSKQFFQVLADWAYIIDLKPKGAKYKNNGGPFDPCFAYFEFVVIHEFLHFTESDFHYQHIIPKANPKIINWVGDFRSNHLLVKSGFQQLPMGLYNDMINFDRQQEYIDMYNMVKEEFDKLSEEQKNDIQNDLDGGGGGEDEDEDEDGDQEGGEPGEGKPGKGEPGEDGEPGDEEGEGEESDGGDKGKPSKKKRKGRPGRGWDNHDPGQEEAAEDAEGKEAAGQKSEKDINEHGKRTNEQMGESQDKDPDQVKKERSEQAAKDAKKSEAGGRGGLSHADRELHFDQIKPKMSWEEIKRKFVGSPRFFTNETYARLPRSAVTAFHQAAQGRAAAAKPAITRVEDKKVKLCFVVDESGSMMGTTERVYAEMFSLFRSKGMQDAEFALIRFSSSFHIWRGSFKTGKASPVSQAYFTNGQEDAGALKKDINNILNHKPQGEKDLKTVFTECPDSGATNFDAPIANRILGLLNEGWNVLICSDSDVCGGPNLTEVLKCLHSKKGKCFLVLADKRDLEYFTKANKNTAPDSVTYLP